MSARRSKKTTARKSQPLATETTMKKPTKTATKTTANATETTSMKLTPKQTKTTPAPTAAKGTTMSKPKTVPQLSPSIAAATMAPAVDEATASTLTLSSGANLSDAVNSLSSLLDSAEPTLGIDDTQVVTSAQKRRKVKPRKGFEKVFGLIAPIVEQHGLNSTSLNTTDMLAQNAKAQTLVPLQTRLQKLSKRVDDEVFNSQSDAWEMGLQFYSLLQRRAKSDGELAQNVAPIAKVFSYRHPTVKEEKPTKVQTRVKARLKATLAIAGKHGIDVTEPSGAAAAAPASQASSASSAAPPAVVASPTAAAAATSAVVPAPASTLVVTQALPQSPVPAVTVTATPVVTPGH